MIKSLIRLVALVVVGVLVYNYFLGDPGEKETASKIFQEVKDVGSSVADLLRSEKEKLDSGKYDAALDKIGGLFSSIRTNKDELSGDYDGELTNLEKEREALEERLRELENSGADENSPEVRNLKDDLDSFMTRTKRMIEAIQSK
ncbi:MAG: hypothetical protein KDC34_15090 [Saprospiraceae bacterium]|nr:hypothetical protein [Saprospiraceae bacterium]